MELFNYFIIILIISIIILILYFNDKIKAMLYNYYIEPFAVEENIGLKWLYLGNTEPNGNKINNEGIQIYK